MADLQQIHVTFYKNVQSPSEPKDVLVKANISKSEMLTLSSELLHVSARRIFNSTGKPLESFDGITDGTILYVSQGEAFQVKRSSGPGGQTTKCNLVMLGAAAVGKSAITLRYVANKFMPDYDPTIEDFYAKLVHIDNQPTQVSILDTAGMEDYVSLIDHWIEKKEAFVLVCSVQMPQSIERLREFYEKIMHRYEMKDPMKSPVMVIAANKIDVQDRLVTTEHLTQLAAELGNIKLFEVSAQSNTNIDDMFAYIIRELRKKRTPAVAKPAKNWLSWCSLL